MSGKGKTAYLGGTAWDGTGAPPILDAVILVAGDSIEAIGPPDLVKVPRGAREVRLDGQFVIPGLIDSHVHTAHWTLSRFLAYGVTTVRDVGGWEDSILALRDSVNTGSVRGPRMYVAGAMIDGPGATRPSATVVTTPQQARRAIDQRTLEETSLAKVYTKITPRLLAPLLDEAKVLNLPVTGHLGMVDASTAARMGLSALEHISGVVEATVSNPQPYFQAHQSFFAGWNLVERRWAGLDSAALDRTARSLAGTGIAIVPTLTIHEAWGHLADQDWIAGLDLAGVPDEVRTAWNVPDLIRRAGIRPGDYAAFRRSRPRQDLFVRRFLAAGGLVAAGTDTPNQLIPPGASLHRELALLVAAGLTPEQALLAGTRDAARLLRADSLGTLTRGHVADFVVLSGNPLQDISHSRDVTIVVSRGVSYSAADLRREW